MASITERSKAFDINKADIKKTIRDTITAAVPIFGIEVQKGSDYLSAGIYTGVFFFMQLAIRYLKANGVETVAK